MKRTLGLLILGVALLVAGCSNGPSRNPAAPSSPSGAASPAGPRPGRSPDKSTTNGPGSYTDCMRDEGVPNFPEPDVSGGFRMDHDLGIDPGSPGYRQAYEACQGRA